MRTFTLHRDHDISGISGTGTVAEGIEFTDGTCAIRWLVGNHHSTVVWADLKSVKVIHGHNGSTQIVWT